MNDKVISYILDNQIQSDTWNEVHEEVNALMNDHDQLIRDISQYILDNKAGGGEARRAIVGVYYDEVQKYVTWVINTADEVWAGKWGNGDEARLQKFLDAGYSAADYAMVKARVNATKDQHMNITISGALKYRIVGGKQYVYDNVPSWRGNMTMYGYNQHALGQAPWKFDRNGCGFISFFSVIKTIKGYTTLSPAEYADTIMSKVGGTNCPISSSVGIKMLEEEGIKYTWVKRYTTAQLTQIVAEHLRKGKPAIISLYKNNRAGKEDKRYTIYSHYAVLTHMHSDGKRAWLNDSGGHKPRLVDLYDICDHCPQANEKITFDSIWNGFQNCGGVILINP